MAKNEQIKLLYKKKSAALIEYLEDGTPTRVSVPTEQILYNADKNVYEAPKELLRSGIPYGAPWEELFPDVHITGLDVEKELHKNGIWTVDDLRNNPKILQGVVMSLTSDILRATSKIIKNYSSKEERK